MEYGKDKSLYQRGKKKAKKKSKKGDLQKKMFLEIWEEREHVSEISGAPLGDEPNVWFFAHVRSKGSAPHLKLNKENIMLVTQEEHWDLDQNTDRAKDDPKFKPFFDKLEELKIKYP